MAACAQPINEAIIIGGGPAGAALGTHLARRGRVVEIVEQSAGEHHKVCGEFLSSEAIAYLEELGLDLGALGAAPIHGVRLAERRRIATCELPFTALSITRRRLDEALLSLASQAGATVRRGRRVESLQRTGPGWTTRLAGGETRNAQAAFLATGKHDIAGFHRPPGKQNDLIAFKMYFRLAPAQAQALRGWVELIVFRGGYAGLQLTEDSEANLCLLVNRAAFERRGNKWPALLKDLQDCSDHLSERLEEAEPLLAKPLALSSIPYGMLQSQAASGLWRLGDQAAVIPSFCGDGISIALHSARMAADIYIGGGTPADYCRQLHAELSGSVCLATAMSRMIVAAPALAHLARFWPPLLGHLALRTRIAETALRVQTPSTH